MKRRLLGLALCLLLPSCATVQDGARDARVDLPGTEQLDMVARSGRTYRIFVAPPEGAIPEPGCPVLYVTDAHRYFPLVREACRSLRPPVPGICVVGIGYPEEDEAVFRRRRAFDLVGPASEDFLRTLPPAFAALETGGNTAFMDFIELELMPTIARRYAVDPRRQALFGHSFGGLFVLDVLFSRPRLFQTYLASSPSIWWADRATLTRADAFLASPPDEDGPRLLLTCGTWEEEAAPGVPAARAALLVSRGMVTNARALSARLAGRAGLTVLFREFPEEEHGTVVFPAVSLGARFFVDHAP